MPNTNIALIDGTNLAHRAYHSLAATHGEDVTAAQIVGRFRLMVGGFLMQLTIPRPRAIVALDAGDSGRRAIYPEYKATRKPRPQPLREALDGMPGAIARFGALSARVDGYEADDVIATIAARLVPSGAPIAIVSGDSDLLQLLDLPLRDPAGDPLAPPQIEAVRPRNGGAAPDVWDWWRFVRHYGFAACSFAAYHALVGEPGDNIRGIPGVGPVTAKALLVEHDDMAGIYAALAAGTLAPRFAKLLTGTADLAARNLALTTLRQDVPLGDALDAALEAL